MHLRARQVVFKCDKSMYRGKCASRTVEDAKQFNTTPLSCPSTLRTITQTSFKPRRGLIVQLNRRQCGVQPRLRCGVAPDIAWLCGRDLFRFATLGCT